MSSLALKTALSGVYMRLGGKPDRVHAILLDFYAAMSRDVLIGFFFDGKDLSVIAAKQAAFLLRAMGATESYAGKAPAQAHTQLPPILTGHLDRRLRILEQTLSQHGLTAADIATWVAFEEAFRDAVVTTK